MSNHDGETHCGICSKNHADGWCETAEGKESRTSEISNECRRLQDEIGRSISKLYDLKHTATPEGLEEIKKTVKGLKDSLTLFEEGKDPVVDMNI